MINFDLSFFYNSKNLDLKNSLDYKSYLKKATDIGIKLKNELQNGENEILNSFTSKYQKKIKNLKNNINSKNKKKIIIGLGGSSSGAKAISHFIKDDIVYFDNLDLGYLKNFLDKEKLENYFFFVISKSGDTFETLAILNLLINFTKNKKKLNILDSIIVITENKNSFLKKFVEQNNINFIEHNPRIGGRFSIFSETGMLPFFDLKIDVEKITEKYLNLLEDYENDLSPIKNSAIILTSINHYKLNIYCNLLYNYKLKHFSYWFHQLHAESLGKSNKGLTPITSICPKDHHSMMQLYLDGPKDKFFNIFSPPDDQYFDKFGNFGFSSIEKYTPSELLNRQFKSVAEVFCEKDIPHRIININNSKNPENIIDLFSYFLLETLILGFLLDINPYDQPEVELIKNKI